MDNVPSDINEKQTIQAEVEIPLAFATDPWELVAPRPNW